MVSMVEQKENIYAVGDIHGCFDKLHKLIRKIDINPQKDQLIFIGDYIDRGAQTYEVIDYLLELKERFNRIVFLKGNHEEMLLQYIGGKDRLTYMVNGGQQTLESYINHHRSGSPSPFPPEHRFFFKSLRLYFETPDYIFVHAGLKAKIPLTRQSPEDMLWIRREFITSRYNFGKPVVFGHSPFSRPLVEANKIGIDTGAVYGGPLTCVKLPELKFFQA